MFRLNLLFLFNEIISEEISLTELQHFLQQNFHRTNATCINTSDNKTVFIY